MRIAVSVLGVAVLLAACGQQGGAPGTPAADETAGAAAEGSLRVALGDIEGVETLNLLIALERVRERGIDVELIEFAEEDLAAEAVLGGQADVTLGAPYAVIQATGAPIRIICQL